MNYSYRSATMGSTPSARRAGKYAADPAMRSIRQTARPKLIGSVGFTPQINPRSKLALAAAAATPNAMPMNTTLMVWRITIPNTSPGCAPRAIRTPISLVLSAVAYDVTPYTPIIASRPANKPKIVAINAMARFRWTESLIPLVNGSHFKTTRGSTVVAALARRLAVSPNRPAVRIS